MDYGVLTNSYYTMVQGTIQASSGSGDQWCRWQWMVPDPES